MNIQLSQQKFKQTDNSSIYEKEEAQKLLIENTIHDNNAKDINIAISQYVDLMLSLTKNESLKTEDYQFFSLEIKSVIKKITKKKHFTTLNNIDNIFSNKIKLLQIENKIIILNQILGIAISNPLNSPNFDVNDIKQQLDELGNEVSQFDVDSSQTQRSDIESLTSLLAIATSRKSSSQQRINTSNELDRADPIKMSIHNNLFNPASLLNNLSSFMEDINCSVGELQKRNDLKSVKIGLKNAYILSRGSFINPINWFRSLFSYLGIGELGRLRTLSERIDRASANRDLNEREIISMLKNGRTNYSDQDFIVKFNQGADLSDDILLAAAKNENFGEIFLSLLKSIPSLNHFFYNLLVTDLAKYQKDETIIKLISLFPPECLGNKMNYIPSLHAAFDHNKGVEALLAMIIHGGKEAMEVREPYSEDTILHRLAADKKYANVLKILLEIADPEVLNRLNYYGMRPVDLAMRYHRDPELLKKLIQKTDVELNPGNRNPLSYAAQYQPSENLDRLITYFPSESFYEKDSEGNTPLHLAVKENKDAKIIADMIVKGGVAALKVQDNKGNTILHLLSQKPGYSELITDLLEIIDLEVLSLRNDSNWSALDMAMEHQTDLNLLKNILAKADPALIRGAEGRWSPLHMVACNQSAENIEKLLVYFPSDCFSNQNGRGDTPIHVAVMKGLNAKIVAEMVKKGGQDAFLATYNDLTFLDLLLVKSKPEFITEILEMLNGDNGLFHLLSEYQSEKIINHAFINLDFNALEIARNSFNFKEYDISTGEGKRLEIYFDREPIELFNHARAIMDQVPEKREDILILLKVINNHTYQLEGTLLHQLIDEHPQNPDAIKLLLEAGGDPYLENKQDSESITPIDWIMENEERRQLYLPSIRHLNECFGELSEMTSKQPNFHFWDAIVKGDVEALKRAWDKNHSILESEKPGTESALHLAARQNNVEIVEMLLEAGCNPNLGNEYGWSPLKIAAVRGNQQIFEVLAQKKNVKENNFKEASALLNGWKSYLHKVFSWVNIKDPLKMIKDPSLAEIITFRQEIELMLKYSEGVESRLKECEYARKLIKSIPSIEILLQTALDQENLPVEAVKLLRQKGANLNERDDQGQTALHTALEQMDIQRVEQLLELGANPNSKNFSGQTPMHNLIENICFQEMTGNSDRLKIIQAFLKALGDINAQDNNGITIAHLIGKNGRVYTDIYKQEQITYLLIELVQSPQLNDLCWDLTDNHGKTGLDYARKSGNQDLFAAIEKETGVFS
ncbi:MAG: ankyrin repeat domain-containing protein [Candidatus Protochlamydia sp.]|nr:ankyrin repeat domain-containing protein [Candidatus Protochlamydia sp.]